MFDLTVFVEYYTSWCEVIKQSVKQVMSSEMAHSTSLVNWSTRHSALMAEYLHLSPVGNPWLSPCFLAISHTCILLLPGCWLFPSSTRTGIEVAQCLIYIVFDEVSPKSTSSILSLPKTCCVRWAMERYLSASNILVIYIIICCLDVLYPKWVLCFCKWATIIT